MFSINKYGSGQAYTSLFCTNTKELRYQHGDQWQKNYDMIEGRILSVVFSLFFRVEPFTLPYRWGVGWGVTGATKLGCYSNRSSGFNDISMECKW